MSNNGVFVGTRGDAREHVANYQFDVREEPIYSKSGSLVPKKRAIIREDTDDVVGIVGGYYKVISHANALDPILEALDKRKVSTFKRVALTKNGARMYANIYFPDQEMNFTGADSARDNCWPGISVINGLDGLVHYTLEQTIYRLACTNGLRVPVSLATLKTKHTVNTDVGKMVDDILESIGDISKFSTLQKWANIVMSPDEMGNMADKIVKDKRTLFPVKYLDDVKAEIAHEAKFGVVSVWGLYNAFNSILEHELLRNKGKVERSRMLDENLYKVFEKTFK